MLLKSQTFSVIILWCLHNCLERETLFIGVISLGSLVSWWVLPQSCFSSFMLMSYWRWVWGSILHLSRDRIIRPRLERCPFLRPLKLGSLWSPPQIPEANKFWSLFQARGGIPFISVQIENWDLYSSPWIYSESG